MSGCCYPAQKAVSWPEGQGHLLFIPHGPKPGSTVMGGQSTCLHDSEWTGTKRKLWVVRSGLEEWLAFTGHHGPYGFCTSKRQGTRL